MHDSAEEFDWEFSEEIGRHAPLPEGKEEVGATTEEKPTSDLAEVPDDKLKGFIEGDEKILESLVEPRRELEPETIDQKSSLKDELERKDLELTNKQELILSLEKKNMELQEELNLKLKYYEKQSKELQAEKDEITKREKDLEKKIKEHQEKNGKNYWINP